MSIPAFIASSVSAATRRRIVLMLTALALALCTLVAPNLTSSAGASTLHLGRNTPAANAKITAQYARLMLARMNYERHINGKSPLRMNYKLIKSAHGHNLTMAKANTMSHQLPGEAFFADRISRAGYNWQSAGENIGWNSDLSMNGIFYLQYVMFHEKAPNDGHRVNILNSSYTQVGIDIYYDAAHNKMWFTQDFAQPMH